MGWIYKRGHQGSGWVHPRRYQGNVEFKKREQKRGLEVVIDRLVDRLKEKGFVEVSSDDSNPKIKFPRLVWPPN